MNDRANPPPAAILLAGLDGSKPLAFLAAIGALRAMTLARPETDVRMQWTLAAGAWRPQLLFTGLEGDSPSEEWLLATLAAWLCSRFEEHPAYACMAAEDPCGSDMLRACTATSRNGSPVDWFSSLSSDLAPEATSQLQTVRKDYFLGNIESIIARTEPDHLHRALFRPWDYADALDNQSLHFDPTEDRRHAYQWSEPSGDPQRKRRGGMLGANRLAIEALPAFQSVTVGEKLSTRGFRGLKSTNTQWTWAIWSAAAGYDVVCSLLGLAELQEDQPNPLVLRSYGIAAAFRLSRILVGKTPNFTAARALF